jgi:hypothetical protein
MPPSVIIAAYVPARGETLMTSKALFAAVGMALAAPTMLSAPAFGTDEKTYHAPPKHYHHHECKVSHHTTGTVVGGVGGAVAGGVLIGGPVATVAGGVGGALLGRHIDKHEHEKREAERGC